MVTGEQNIGAHMTRRYVLALSIIAVMLLCGTAAREWHHRRHLALRAHSEIVNRQMRLVSRTSHMAQSIASISQPQDRAAPVAQLAATFAEMQRYQQSIAGVHPLASLYEYYGRYLQAGRQMVEGAGSDPSAAMERLLALSEGDAYQQAMQWIADYERGEQQSLRRIMWFERSMLLLTLLTLLAEALFIFRPMVGVVHRVQSNLLQLNRMKSEFMANMSHEIRTPINAIFGISELLMQSEVTGKQRGQIETLMHSADTLLTLIDDVLDFSKIEAGQLEIEQVPFDLHASTEDVAELLASKAREKRLEIIVRYMPGTPQLLLGDPGRVRQILMNLIGNAIKFTDTGYVLITIEQTGEAGRDAWVPLKISVEDTGIGIAPEKLETIFDMFSQGDGSTTRRYGGTGLGLTISRQLARLMGGEMGVASKEGEGSTFWLTLRLPRAEQRAGAFEPSHAILSGKRVLVVDDIEANRALLTDSLQPAKLQVHACASGREALKELRRAQEERRAYDMVLVDYLMPEMNGETLIRALRNDPLLSHLPVIVLSSAEEKGFIKIFSAMQVAAYLTKPVRRAQLLDMIAMVLEATVRGQPFDMLTIHASEALRARLTFAHGVPLAGVRILLTEDNRINREFTTELLESMGCRVDHAENGEVALQKCREAAYDIILMDCQMPVMDGFEAASAIQRMKTQGEMGDVPIIALTANAMDGDRERCLRAGMHDYLSKPVRRGHLEAMLLHWLKDIEPVPISMALPAPQNDMPVVPAGPIVGIDPHALAETRQMVGEKLGMLIGYFIEDAQRYLSEIEQALLQGQQAQGFVAPAHTLKSSARQFGLLTLSELARRIEEIGREAESMDAARARVHPLMEPMQAAFAQARAYLEQAHAA